MYTRESLRELLEAHNVPLDVWGSGEAKTLEHLLSEIQEGESVLKPTLMRYSLGAGVNVYCRNDGKLLCLRETKQVYADGRERTRSDMRFSIGEKMKVGEDPLAAAKRALEEELGITEEVPLIACRMERKGPIFSSSFPGLVSYFEMHIFNLDLPGYLYRPEGYVEQQKDKSSYFEWVELTDDPRP